MASYTIEFVLEDRGRDFPRRLSARASEGYSLLEVIREMGLELLTPCGGEGTCGRCKVRVISGRVQRATSAHLSEGELKGGWCLACNSAPLSDLVVEIPRESRLERKGPRGRRVRKKEAAVERWEVEPFTRKVVLEVRPPSLEENFSDLERVERALFPLWGSGKAPRYRLGTLQKLGRLLREQGGKVTLTLAELGETLEVVEIEAGDRAYRQYGLALDVGTTTLSLTLLNLYDGRIIDEESDYNPQLRFGEDVISRIVYASRPGGLETIRGAVLDEVNRLAAQVSRRNAIEPHEINSLSLAGNPAMLHLLLGLDPRYIREEPYIPTLNFFPVLRAEEVGLDVAPHAPIYVLPGVGSFVGGDITAGVLGCSIDRSDGLTLYIDIGTNGEIVIGNRGWMMACACSAGPAFEGAGVRSGMRATDGAIESVSIEPGGLEPRVSVIGGGPPRGLCGSGLIDLFSELFRAGALDRAGKLIPQGGNPRVRHGERGAEYVLAWAEQTATGQDIALTEVDLDNLLRTKAAIYAGISSLTQTVGLPLEELEKIVIAGEFGSFINVESAVTIGLLPDLPRERFHAVGNSSLIGAQLALLSKDFRTRAEEIARRMTYVELSADPSYMDRYLSALFLPHTELELFPSLKARFPNLFKEGVHVS